MNIDKLRDKFTHLHMHSAYSIKDGTIPISTLVDKQVAEGAKGIAVTDHGMMTGGWFLYDYINNVKKHKEVKTIIGIEAYLSETRDELNTFLAADNKDMPSDERSVKRKQLAQKYHQILLCKNKKGYQNAVKIHNDAWQNGFYYSPATTKQMIFNHHEGLIATTTCLASLWCKKIMNGDLQGAEKELLLWKEVFGDDFYVELQPTHNRTQALVNVELIKLARKTNTKMIVTNDVHYIDKGDHELHFTLLNLGNLKKNLEADEDNQEKLWEFNVDDLYIKRLDEMYDSWKEHHKSDVFTESVFESTIHNIAEIVDKVEKYTLESRPLLPQVNDQNPTDKLKSDVIRAFKDYVAKGIIPKDRIAEYEDRVVEELNTIVMLQAENYINIYHDIADWCKNNNILVGAGRGSAPSSLLLYLLGITDVDPIKHGLIFARFLTTNRRAKLVI